MEKYLEIYLPNHHRAKVNGYVDEHIVLAEQLLGRELKDEEVVHHKDENKYNNSLDNLIVFIDLNNHTRYHHTKIMQETNEKHVYFAPKQYEDECIMCGKFLRIKTKHDMCKDCYNVHQRKVKRPSKDELQKLINTISFVQIGKMYNVSDNAVRKWCKRYNLL